MGTARIPVDVRYLDEQVVIVDNRAFGLKSGLPAGAALISVDDAEVAPMVEAMKKTWPKPIEASFRIALTASAWLTCPPDAKKKVTFVPHGAKKPKTKTVKCREPKVERLSMGNIKDFPATFESKMLPGKIGYVRFNIWLLPLAAKIQQAIHDLKADEMKGLVIDLRGNPGGVGMMVVPVGRVLVDKPTSLGTMRLREMTQDFKIVEPDAPFEGPVVLLVDERTGSTSEIFAVALRELGRVTVVGGSPSQGAALPSLIEELPGGARLQYVVADYRTPGGDVVEGKGVQPDVLVDESAADFAAGKDPALEAAIAAASGEAPPPRTAPEAGAASDAKTGATPEKKDQ
jgi:carboxyl-terminal processing protease